MKNLAVSSVAAVALFVLQGLILGCGAPPAQAPIAGDGAVPEHYFIAQDPGPSASVECSMVADQTPWSEMWRRPLSPCTLGTGWAGFEPWGIWVISDRAHLTINLRSTDWDRMTIHAEAFGGLPDDVDQEMTVEINGRIIGTTGLARSWDTYTIDIPQNTLEVGLNSVTLSFTHRSSPERAGRGADRRLLAGGVKSIGLADSDRITRREDPQKPSQIFERTTGRFVIDEPGTLVMPIEVPGGTRQLELDVRLAGAGVHESATVTSIVRSLDGRFVSRTEHTASGSDRTHAGRWSIPIDANATGHSVLASFESHSLPPGTQLSMSPVRPVPARPDGRSEPTPTQAEETDSRTPDIVVITLDAARPDHFSHAGYPRPTTPKIDRLAEQALVFRNAFALAPYTLCSVPTMITGLSFLDHGVVSRRDVLSPVAVTMAEYLRAAGYRTAAFTTTPNNSAAKGYDQGYDEFFEMWRDVPRGTARNPHYVAREVIEWLGAVGEAQPIHLQVHLIPPHGPYAPADRFDRFTDPDYSGPCNGGNITLDHLESGAIPASEECLENVIGLYDGNLLAADDAVGQLLDALRARRRWPETVVLVTSDHGEAFLEHGRMTHNSTVFDEMLRVPFILRTPAWMDTSLIDTNRLVTLADIVPTLLATASIQPSTPLEGVNLFRIEGDTRLHDPRFFVAGNTDKPPLLGLRTRRWKLLLSDPGHGALFDLVADPRETTNIRFEEPALFAGLGMLLTDRVERPSTLAPSADSSEITEEDRKMLEALGYVE